MEMKLIQTENYLLVVDDSEIKEGDYVLLTDNSIVVAEESDPNPKRKCNIIAHLPLHKPFIYGYTPSPILEGINLLPSLPSEEDDIERMGEESADNYKYLDCQSDYVGGFISGYNKSKEKYKYTEEDIAKAVMFGRWGGTTKKEYQDFIQSLSQPKMPVGFECEMETKIKHIPWPKDLESKYDWELGYPDTYQIPKTTTNSQGQTQLIGKYLYN